MNPFLEQLNLTRRHFFGQTGLRLGGVAMAMLAGSSSVAQGAAASPRMQPPLKGFPHFAPKAQSLIYLHMNGGPAQMDLLDHKPQLAEFFDKDLPESVRLGQRIGDRPGNRSRGHGLRTPLRRRGPRAYLACGDQVDLARCLGTQAIGRLHPHRERRHVPVIGRRFEVGAQPAPGRDAAGVSVSLVSIVHTRLELVSNDIAEEREHLVTLLVLVQLALFFMGVGVVLLALLVVVAFWETHRLLALGGVTGLFLLASAAAERGLPCTGPEPVRGCSKPGWLNCPRTDST